MNIIGLLWNFLKAFFVLLLLGSSIFLAKKRGLVWEMAGWKGKRG